MTSLQGVSRRESINYAIGRRKNRMDSKGLELLYVEKLIGFVVGELFSDYDS